MSDRVPQEEASFGFPTLQASFQPVCFLFYLRERKFGLSLETLTLIHEEIMARRDDSRQLKVGKWGDNDA